MGTESPKFVSLESIPTLGDQYANGTLSQVAEKRLYEVNEPLLQKVSLLQGDITTLKVGSIVNAANGSLLGGGGVDGAIHRAAGGELYRECRTLNGCDTGKAKITKGYNLPASHVIHTVGPIYYEGHGGGVAEQLRSCYNSSLTLATENSLRSIAFCAISTGVYGYPIVEATNIALDTTRKFLESDEGGKLDRVIFVVFSDLDNFVYQELLPHYFPGPQPQEASTETQAANVEPVLPLTPPPIANATIHHDEATDIEIVFAAEEADTESSKPKEGTEVVQDDVGELAETAPETISTA